MKNIELSRDKKSVVILDQTRLPNEEVYLSLSTAEEFYNAIYTLQIRGAPAIGVFTGFALYVLSQNCKNRSQLEKYAEYLVSSRPTAVNLQYAAKRTLDSDDLLREALAIESENEEMCLAIAEHAVALVKDGAGILTYCNAGSLAAGKYGTALGGILLGTERGMKFKAYCCETRPLMQGTRLTAYELMKAGVDVTLICDNAAGYAMGKGLIQAVFAGADRVAANGDAANKIGTSSVAILAKHYGIPFYIFCPSTTIDVSAKTGADIVIEERGAEEITEKFFKQRIAPGGVKVLNPAFDVTNRSLITAIVTEKGFFRSNSDTQAKIK